MTTRMPLRRPRPRLLAAFAAIVIAVVALAFAATDDDRATAASTVDVRVGRVVAAYVAPNELVFAPSDGAAQESLPVASDVTVTNADGSTLSYDDFTLAIEQNGGASHRLTVVDGWVTSIVEGAT